MFLSSLNEVTNIVGVLSGICSSKRNANFAKSYPYLVLLILRHILFHLSTNHYFSVFPTTPVNYHYFAASLSLLTFPINACVISKPPFVTMHTSPVQSFLSTQTYSLSFLTQNSPVNSICHNACVKHHSYLATLPKVVPLPTLKGRGGGLEVSILAYYSDDPSLNPADY